MASTSVNASVGSSGGPRVAIADVLILGLPLPPQGSDSASLGKRGKMKSLDSGLALIKTPSENRESVSSTLHIV